MASHHSTRKPLLLLIILAVLLCMSLPFCWIVRHHTASCFKLTQQLQERPAEPLTNVRLVSLASSNSTAMGTHERFNFDFPLCFIHIGKAAGSGTSCALGFVYADCQGRPRPALPDAYAFHMRHNQCPTMTATNVVTLRNPITRIQSWFEFEKNIIPGKTASIRKTMKVKRRLLFDCFEDLESLALAMDEVVSRNIKSGIRMVNATFKKEMTCSERAWAAILGARSFSYHEYYNYEFYLLGSMQQANASWKVLRMEHLSDDWESISSDPLFRHVNRGRSNATNAGQSALSNQAMRNLCRALCDEIQVYKQFLQRANNLTPEQVLESILEVQAFCPKETMEQRPCLGIPTFPLVPTPKKKYERETKKRFLVPI